MNGNCRCFRERRRQLTRRFIQMHVADELQVHAFSAEPPRAASSSAGWTATHTRSPPAFPQQRRFDFIRPHLRRRPGTTAGLRPDTVFRGWQRPSRRLTRVDHQPSGNVTFVSCNVGLASALGFVSPSPCGMLSSTVVPGGVRVRRGRRDRDVRREGYAFHSPSAAGLRPCTAARFGQSGAAAVPRAAAPGVHMNRHLF